MGATHSKKTKKAQPIFKRGRLHVGSTYKLQMKAGKNFYRSDTCKKLTRKEKCKYGYILHFGKEQLKDCYTFANFTFKRCTPRRRLV